MVIVPDAAVLGPLFLTTMLVVIDAFCATGLGDLVLVIDKSRPSGTTLKLRLVELLDVSASGVAEVIAAVLV